MYTLIESSIADTGRLFDYLQRDTYGADFHLKGFEYAWIIRSRKWQVGEKIADIGGAYSQLPDYLVKTYGCETWVVDDFGTKSNEEFWLRNRDLEEFLTKKSPVNYVIERLGNPAESSLQEGFFDVVISASALEHVPNELMPAVWKHMDLILKPGGEMLHGIDLKVQADRGKTKLMIAGAIDRLAALLPTSWMIKHVRATPTLYMHGIKRSIGLSSFSRRDLPGALDLVMDPEILVEPVAHTYNRIIKDGAVSIKHQRNVALLVHLKKEK
ncbi:MAG: class I SAM-dependent methyltransferase [Anaerolineales bacterium]|nr:class I SAM-dependent methyltransferase [Anaerolineales bacterium]